MQELPAYPKKLAHPENPHTETSYTTLTTLLKSPKKLLYPRRRPYLTEQHHAPEEEAWLAQLQEGEQVHALILSLLQQSVDPSIVLPHASQGSHVAQHPPNHPWDTCTPHTCAVITVVRPAAGYAGQSALNQNGPYRQGHQPKYWNETQDIIT